MTGYLVLFGLFIGACGWVLMPLFRNAVRQDDLTGKPVDRLDELKNKKNSVYAVIKELEFDLNMGKLTEEDFQILKRQYTQEAVDYLKEIDQLTDHQEEN